VRIFKADKLIDSFIHENLIVNDATEQVTHLLAEMPKTGTISKSRLGQAEPNGRHLTIQSPAHLPTKSLGLRFRGKFRAL
jgi:hypothetical protein